MGKHVHEIQHDGRYRYDYMTNQDNDNLVEMNYSLKTHMKWSDGLIYKHCKEEVRKNIDI